MSSIKKHWLKRDLLHFLLRWVQLCAISKEGPYFVFLLDSTAFVLFISSTGWDYPTYKNCLVNKFFLCLLYF